MMNPDTFSVIEHFLGREFFKNNIIHNSWFYLMSLNLLTNEDLEQKLLALRDPADD